jgi:hypothetical protein
MNDRVALLLPSRGRPEKLRRAVDSVAATAARRDDVVVVIGVDDDDGQTLELSQSYKPNVPVLWSSGPRELTLGRLNNRLAATEHGCDILSVFADDNVMATQDWDNHFRYACSLMPKGYGTAWATDGVHHSTDVCTAPLITRSMMNRMGFFLPPWFPFWFGDVWLEEMGAFVGCRLPLAARVELPDGRGPTLNLRDVAFWGGFFQATRRVRLELAGPLIDEMYEGNPGLQISLKLNLAALEMYYARRALILSDPASAAHAEKMQLEAALAENPHYQVGPPSERYLAAKREAEAFLQSLGVAP